MSRIWVNGCFDLMHYGHMHFLQEAEKLADLMVVWMNSDISVPKLEKSHPLIQTQGDRRAQIAAVCRKSCRIAIFDEENPIAAWERAIARDDRDSPDFYAKDEHFFETRPPEYYWLKDRGVKMILIPRVHSISTSSLIRKIQAFRSPQ